MSFLNFASYPLWLNLLLFAAAGAVIWVAGTRLERVADALARQTGLGQAFIGLILLALATSLPEVATTATAVLSNNNTLAIHNLLGGVVGQTAVLVVADFFIARGALTRFTPDFALLIQGVGLVLVLAAAGTAIALGDLATVSINVEGVSLPFQLAGLLLFGTYVAAMFMAYRYRGDPAWVPKFTAAAPVEPVATHASGGAAVTEANPVDVEESEAGQKLKRTLTLFGALALLVLAGGWLVTNAADALAAQTGLGAGFVGFTFLAFATSLPELSVTIAAARHGRNSLAIADIFGSNAFDVMLLAPAAWLAGSQAFFAPTPTALFAASLGIAMTSIYLWGLLVRDSYVIGRIGWDSALNLVLFVVGILVLYWLR